jgi:hypothetical protein
MGISHLLAKALGLDTAFDKFEILVSGMDARMKCERLRKASKFMETGPNLNPSSPIDRASTKARVGLGVAYLLLKFTIAVPHPTPCTQRFCNPGMWGAMSVADTIIWAVNDSSLASPAR